MNNNWLVEITDKINVDDLSISQIQDYITVLEKKIIELSEEISKTRENERLTELWARGEIEN